MIEVSEMEEVVCVKGGHSLQVYLFLVDGMLVDTGAQTMLQELIPFYQSSLIDSVVMTHSHEDHVGTAAWLQQNKNVPLYIHPTSIEFCSKPITYQLYRQNLWGIRDPFFARPIADTIHSKRFVWKVMETPGHADDHVVLLNEETGQLFSGDLFLTPKPKIIMSHESIPAIMNSIRTVLTHDFQSMFCCHAGYVADGKRLLQMKLDYLENMCGEILHLHKQGYTITEIKNRMFPNDLPIISVSEGQFDSVHIVRSVVTEMDS
ncbi:MBL fold metallo-hydrolase [Brevibacillus sp. SYP-B805]|uniref:MBL fold metallo-hydrolase n=1 Tax=Brevibacillus sp. SYP-B805 TaxID=1578199 RepID=UPI0013EC1E1C|nr:MBL fold metallo-hydrolase [Brevibacillus sp. SYP-B805]NGQ95778.1 MBL fold metallo-hydrolase [Brevibacillus sp. SYP-B805]